MKIGDFVRATWKDGLILEGVFVGQRRGYIILEGADGENIVCCPNTVDFQVIQPN